MSASAGHSHSPLQLTIYYYTAHCTNVHHDLRSSETLFDARDEQHEGVEGAALAAPIEAGRPLRHGAGGHAVPGAHLASQLNNMHKKCGGKLGGLRDLRDILVLLRPAWRV